MSKHKVSMVSYLNSKPFILGFELTNLLQELELHLEVPSKTANKLIDRQVNIALVPVAMLPNLPSVHLFSDYCIGANGKVDSVYLFSEVPLQEIETIYLDSHSRTSANLLKVLMLNHWKIETIQWVDQADVTSDMVRGKAACLMIGDKAMKVQSKFKYAYDLAEAWKEYTGLPFVFAVWVSTSQLSKEEITRFNKAFKTGIEHSQQLVQIYQDSYPTFDLSHYYSESIDYDLDREKLKSLDMFLRQMAELPKQSTVKT